MRKTKTIFACLSALLFLSAPLCSAAQQPLQDSNREATELLQQYLRIDTTNPPGNEKAGAEFLAKVLKQNGIEAQIFDTDKNRACVYARLKGNGKKKAIVLLNHIDVVPAEPKDWKYPPFGGEIHDGEIWGRGALDMKGVAIAQLEAMLMLKRSGKTLDRDIIFLGTPDEEVGGHAGAAWFAQNKADLVKDAEYLFNEGFFIDTDPSGKVLYWGVDIAEKSVLWLQLKTKGNAGHASMPMPDSANNRLVAALDRVIDSPPPPKILPAVREYFKAISVREKEPWKTLFARLDDTVKNPSEYQTLLSDKLKSSMVRNTVSLTVLKSGYKTNVIPAEAHAELDCRLLPDVKKDDFIASVKQTINDPTVEVSVLDWVHAEASPYETEAFKAIKEVAAEMNPGAPVVPVVVPWFTDSHWFRELGITSYGFDPFRMDPAHVATMHGKDERIPVAVFNDGIKATYEVLRRLSTSN